MKSLEKIVKIALISGATVFSTLSLDSCVVSTSKPNYSYPVGSQKHTKEIIKKYHQGEKDFQGENLRYAYLRYEVLNDVNFSKANFYQANLECLAYCFLSRLRHPRRCHGLKSRPGFR